VVRDEATIPTQQRVGRHDEDRPAVTAERSSERGEDCAVVGFEPWMWLLAFQHRKLVAQHEDLDIFGTILSAAQHQQVDHEPDKTAETRHMPIFAASQRCRSIQTRTPAQHAWTDIRHPQAFTELARVISRETHRNSVSRGQAQQSATEPGAITQSNSETPATVEARVIG
jgi:hypothetical protein